MNGIWSKEKAWQWYNAKTWIVGCNYVPHCCISSIEVWQEYGFDDVCQTVKWELSLASSIGMNSIRMMLPIEVWKHQHDGFIKRFNFFLDLLAGFGITMMPVFFDDCSRRPIDLPPWKIIFGPQPQPVPGHHGGFPPIENAYSATTETYHMADDRNNWALMEAFVKEIIGAHKNDERILAWDIWNEPGNTGAGGFGNVSKSLPAMEAAFGWAREMEPIQPLTASAWDFYHDYFERKKPGELTEIEQKAVELSDIVSFHYYGDLTHSMQLINAFKSFDRPLFITEWLHRPFKNYVRDHLPLYKSERIACYSWGLVNGKTQTHEPWPWIKDMDLDFSEWQHDLFKSDGTPYKEDEIALFRQLTTPCQHQADFPNEQEEIHR